jgi:glycosyltransferase involved in cell wall biosynthesis
MRVLLVTNMYPDAARPAFGAFVRAQVESLRAAGVEVEVLFLDGQRSRLEYARGRARVRRAAEEPFDLVHAHYGLSGWAAAAQRRLPLLVTFHGDDLLGSPSRLGGLTVKSRVARRMGLRAARRAVRLLVVSEGLRRALPAALRPRAVVLPMGVDLRRFAPIPRDEACRRLGLPEDRRRILFLGDPRLPVKRFALAAAAAALVRRGLPDVDLHVVHGRPPETIPLHLNASDVLLLTSRHEGSPMAVKEALACDLPVVSVDAGDVAERLRGIEGCHVVAADARALAQALRFALDRGARIAGRAAVEPLSLERVARRLLEVYREAARPA